MREIQSPAKVGPQASRTNTWSPALLGMVIALLGLILAGGGAYLAALGGDWYYVAVGAMFLAAGYLVIKRRIAGFYTYVGAFAFTCVWAFWEVGLSGWQLIPRLVGPFVLLVLAILVAPALDQTTGRRARKLGLVGVGIFVAALAILIPIFNQQPAARPLPDARADELQRHAELRRARDPQGGRCDGLVPRRRSACGRKRLEC